MSLPFWCGAPVSISCATRACSSRSTVPTRGESLPLSNIADSVFNRCTLTSAGKNVVRTPAGCVAFSGKGDTTETRISSRFQYAIRPALRVSAKPIPGPRRLSTRRPNGTRVWRHEPECRLLHGGLAPWQEQHVKELMSAALNEEVPLSRLARVQLICPVFRQGISGNRPEFPLIDGS
jgi:hypothetical protein